MTTIEKVIYALNKIPNTKNVGPNGESTYDLVKELEKEQVSQIVQGQTKTISKGAQETDKGQPVKG